MSAIPVVPKIVPLSEDRFHDLALVCISNMIAQHGREKVAEAMQISTRQLGNIMAGSTPGAFRLANLRCLDPQALDPISRAQGLRSVPRDATCSTDPVSVALARLLAKTIEAEHPESENGPAVSLCEILALPEQELRFAAAALAGSEPWDQLKEQSRIPRVVFNFVQKLVEEDDDQKRDHMLVSLTDLLTARGLGVPSDLVTMADGTAGSSPVPSVERKGPFLAAVDGKANDDFEASEEELAAQKARPSTEQAQAEADAASEAKPGTGAAARAAMKNKGAEADA